MSRTGFSSGGGEWWVDKLSDDPIVSNRPEKVRDPSVSAPPVTAGPRGANGHPAIARGGRQGGRNANAPSNVLAPVSRGRADGSIVPPAAIVAVLSTPPIHSPLGDTSQRRRSTSCNQIHKAADDGASPRLPSRPSSHDGGSQETSRVAPTSARGLRGPTRWAGSGRC